MFLLLNIRYYLAGQLFRGVIVIPPDGLGGFVDGIGNFLNLKGRLAPVPFDNCLDRCVSLLYFTLHVVSLLKKHDYYIPYIGGCQEKNL